MSFTQKILKKKIDDDMRTARMIGAINRNLEVINSDNHETADRSINASRSSIEIPLPSLVMEFRGYARLKDDIYTVDRWDFASLEDHLNVNLIRAIDPTAIIVQRARSNLAWFRGSFVATQSMEAFGKLKAAGKDLVPAYAQACVNILVTSSPITQNFLDAYQSEVANFDRLSREKNALDSAVKASTNLKQAARFLILAKAEDAQNNLGISDELMTHVDAWAETADSLSKKSKKLQREMSASHKRFSSIYPDMTML